MSKKGDVVPGFWPGVVLLVALIGLLVLLVAITRVSRSQGELELAVVGVKEAVAEAGDSDPELASQLLTEIRTWEISGGAKATVATLGRLVEQAAPSPGLS